MAADQQLRLLAMLGLWAGLCSAQCPSAGTFELVSINSGKVLDVSGVSKDNGAPLHQWTDLHAPNQQWQLATVSGLTLSLTGGVPTIYNCTNGRAVVIWQPPQFADAEVPAGAIDGANGVFTLAHSPNPPASLRLVSGGLTLTEGKDYALSGNTITFAPGALLPSPSVGVLQSWYRW